jgi:hypothetical protein
MFSNTHEACWKLHLGGSGSSGFTLPEDRIAATKRMVGNLLLCAER